MAIKVKKQGVKSISLDELVKERDQAAIKMEDAKKVYIKASQAYDHFFAQVQKLNELINRLSPK